MAPTSMLAAVYHPGNENLVIDKAYPIRALKANEVLLKVSACGVCHTDVTLLSGFPLDTRKYVLGHEISGVPVELGADVDPETVIKGKLYSVLPLDGCVHGVAGGAAALNTLGTGLDGGYAEYVILTPDELVPVPDGITAETAAIASDAGITAFHAVHDTAGITEGSNLKVLIFGVGGLGHLAVQYAKHFGATVYACDFKPSARKLALDLGAVEAFDLIELNNKTKAGFTVDVTIDFVATNQSFTLALAALRGNEVNFPSAPKAVIVGFSDENLVFTSGDIISSGTKILSSLYGPRSALEAVLDLFAKGIVHAHVKSEPLQNVNKVLAELRAFEITGRKVVVPSGHHHHDRS